MKVLALTADGEMTYCSAAPEMRVKDDVIMLTIKRR